MNKYSTKRTNNHSFDSYDRHRRDYSPSSRSHSRNSSPESWSPRGSYSSRHSRRSEDRDSKYYDGKRRKHRFRSSRSPVEHESVKSCKNSSNHSTSKMYIYGNGHSSSSSSSSSYSSKKHFGDWSEQISSSGKRYYYNSKTECSQWEKPKEWVDWEKRYSSSRNSNHHHSSDHELDNNPKSYSYSNDNYSSRNSRNSHNSKCTSRDSRSHSHDKARSTKLYDSKRTRIDSDCLQKNEENSRITFEDKKNHKKLGQSPLNPLKINDSNLKQDENDANSQLNSTFLKTLATTLGLATTLDLSRFLTQLFAEGINPAELNEQTFIKLAKHYLKSQQQHSNHKTVSSRTASSSEAYRLNDSPNNRSKNPLHKNSIDAHMLNNNAIDEHRFDLENLKKVNHKSASNSLTTPADDDSQSPSNQADNLSSSLNTISSISSSISQKSSVPNLSRFKHLYREDLIQHVLGWPSEQFKKQANTMLDQNNHIGNHSCTRVSAELKNFRSLVRIHEIKTVLQKKRIISINQQIKNIEEWKGKQFQHYS
ncbi:WW domain-containing adapter protein with coiled-coil [Sarcoptes scabiei]|nr:WW domain-containing adapter protein with coiled-coil [Sarcoptes scabiei]